MPGLYRKSLQNVLRPHRRRGQRLYAKAATRSQKTKIPGYLIAGDYTRAKKSDDNNRPIFCFPSLNRYFFLDTKNAFKKHRFFFTIQICISTSIHMGIFVHFIIREIFKFIILFVEKNVFT